MCDMLVSLVLCCILVRASLCTQHNDWAHWMRLILQTHTATHTDTLMGRKQHRQSQANPHWYNNNNNNSIYQSQTSGINRVRRSLKRVNEVDFCLLLLYSKGKYIKIKNDTKKKPAHTHLLCSLFHLVYGSPCAHACVCRVFVWFTFVFGSCKPKGKIQLNLERKIVQ